MQDYTEFYWTLICTS